MYNQHEFIFTMVPVVMLYLGFLTTLSFVRGMKPKQVKGFPRRAL